MMNMDSETVGTVSLEEDIASCVPGIQDLIAQVLESLCEEGEAGITTISERLGVHRKLAWQLRSVAYSPDPFRAAGFMPSRASFDTLISALKTRGVAPGMIAGLRDGVDSFDRIVAAHAGDRKNLEMLLESHGTGAREPADTKWREKAFQGNSFIWGAQAKTQLSISILSGSQSKPGWIDIAQIRGLIGLRRVRPNVHWLVSQSVVLDDSKAVRPLQRTPIDEESARDMGGVPILPEFCSQPLPRLRRRPMDQGLLHDELLPTPVGSAGQQTVFTGELIRELAPAHATPQNRRAHFGAVVRTPSEVFLMDHFVHRDLFPGVERELAVFGELNSPVTLDDEDLLPVSETIEYRGLGARVARTPDVPRYVELLRWTFGRLGWNAQEFELYRVRLAYPPMPASVVIRHDLPEESR